MEALWLFALIVGVLGEDCPSIAPAALWRQPSKAQEIFLNASNVVCPASCTAPSNATFEDNIMQIVIQEADWLLLHVDLSSMSTEHNISHVTLHPITSPDLGQCGGQFPVDPLVHWVLGPHENVVVGSDLLLPGVQMFGVLDSSSCNVSWVINVTVKAQQCLKGPGAELCSTHGSCVLDPAQVAYSCQCCGKEFAGRFCEERDGCVGGPCQHGGFCVDITEGLSGNSFQCLCPHGYTGQRCEEPVSPCDRKPCLNGGSCKLNTSGAVWCECPTGFTGPRCQTNKNECVPNPCIHGVCEDGDATYKCYCLPGYGGEHCEFEYDECDSSPCINGGACEDLVAGYRCHCGPGYRGRRCQIKVDLCQPNPCSAPAQCVDKGNNYSCVCRPGHEGSGCTQRYDPCYPNPCQSGGTCWPSVDSYFCSCRPGYTGDVCDELRYPTSRPQEAPARDHLHTMYIAAATLAGACVVVLVVVSVCHCRAHRSYQRFTRRVSDVKELKSPRQLLMEPPWERF